WSTAPLPTIRFNSNWSYNSIINYTYPLPGYGQASGWWFNCYTGELGSAGYGVYFDIAFVGAWHQSGGSTLVTATRGASPTGAQQFGNAFLRIVLPYSSMATPFHPGQWHHVALRWQTTTEPLNFGNLGTQNFTYMGGDLFVDGVRATQKSLWAGQVVGGTIRLPPLYMVSNSFGGMMTITRRYGNLGNVGSWFQPLTQASMVGNDTLDMFSECSADEAYVQDYAVTDSEIQGVTRQRRYFAISSDAPAANPTNTDPRFYGTIRRFDDPLYSPNGTAHNNFALDATKVLPTSTTGAVRIRSVAMTQYRPQRDYLWTGVPPGNWTMANQVLLPEATRPRWRFAMKKNTDTNYTVATMQTTGLLWHGDERRPEDIMPAPAAASAKNLAANEFFQYRLFPTAGGFSVPYSRMTPMFDDVTLTYIAGDPIPQFVAWEHSPD
ncbi:MAG: hypothetical protein RDV41_10760, partial [Planctomycetota bacterium]|nr:hypothetical protein [Planctomycetota bacterium]